MSPVVNFLVMIEYKFVKIKLEINFSVVKLLFIESFIINFCEKNKCHGKVPKLVWEMLDFVEDILVGVKSH